MSNVASRPEAYTGPLTENPLIVELFNLLAKNKAAEQYADFSQLVSCVNSMEEQLNRTVTELGAVKQELRSLQESLSKEDRAGFSKLTASLDSAIRQAREQLRSIKSSIIRAAGVAVKGLKDKGVIGLNDALGALGVRKALAAMQTHLDHTAQTLETGMARIEAVRQELQAVGGHIRNIGRAIAGKERQEARADQARSGTSAVLTPLQRIHSVISKARNLAGQAVSHLEELERLAIEKKPSVRETLKKLENKQLAVKMPVKENVLGKEAVL